MLWYQIKSKPNQKALISNIFWVGYKNQDIEKNLILIHVKRCNGLERPLPILVWLSQAYHNPHPLFWV